LSAKLSEEEADNTELIAEIEAQVTQTRLEIKTNSVENTHIDPRMYLRHVRGLLEHIAELKHQIAGAKLLFEGQARLGNRAFAESMIDDRERYPKS
jgi:hypothetical protein